MEAGQVFKKNITTGNALKNLNLPNRAASSAPDRHEATALFTGTL
jgi:hypothetical protein